MQPRPSLYRYPLPVRVHELLCAIDRYCNIHSTEQYRYMPQHRAVPVLHCKSTCYLLNRPHPCMGPSIATLEYLEYWALPLPWPMDPTRGPPPGPASRSSIVRGVPPDCVPSGLKTTTEKKNDVDAPCVHIHWMHTDLQKLFYIFCRLFFHHIIRPARRILSLPLDPSV